MQDYAKFFTVRCPADLAGPPASIDAEIRDFLAGKTDGETLLHLLYGQIVEEPVPESLQAVLKG